MGKKIFCLVTNDENYYRIQMACCIQTVSKKKVIETLNYKILIDDIDDESIKELIYKDLKRLNFKRSQIIIGLNISNIFIEKIRIPNLNSIDSKKTLALEIKKLYGSDFKNNYIYAKTKYRYNRAYFSTKAELKSLANAYSNIVQYSDTHVTLNISRMVFVPDITLIPACQPFAEKKEAVEYRVNITTAFEIPDTVEIVKANSFKNVIGCAGIVAKNTVLFDPEALSEVALKAKTDRTSYLNVIPLTYGIDFNITYYTAEAKLNNGVTVTYTNTINGKEEVITDLKNVIFKDADDQKIISKYLIPNINFLGKTINYSKIEKVIIRRSLSENICTYTAILVDENLNCYKVKNFGYVSDVDWEIKQEFSFDNNEATIRVYLPTYVYNYTNFQDASMEIELLPQVLKSKDVVGLTGIVEVFDGFALSDQKIKIYIKDGVEDPEKNCYVYEKKIENLNTHTVLVNGESLSYNQVSISQIAIVTGDEQDPKYLFIREYK